MKGPHNTRLLQAVETLATDLYGPAAAVSVDEGPTGFFCQVWNAKGLQMHAVRGEKNEAAALKRMRAILETVKAEIETVGEDTI